MAVRLGDQVQDEINGLAGVVTGRAEYLYGCVQVLIAPRTLKADGSPQDSIWLDEARVRVLKAERFDTPENAAARSGGPVSVPPPVR
jgi:hypothetical protein